MDWLDTETKVLLQHSPPEKLAPPDTATFTLVVLAFYSDDHPAMINAAQRAAGVLADEAERLLRRQPPVPVKTGLSYPDAQIAQFELICCDAVSVIIADEVVAEASADYLADLYARLRKSDEFAMVTVRSDSIPGGPSGREFCNRYLGGREPVWPFVTSMMRKKARIMQHWAARIGGSMTIVAEAVDA